MECRCYLRNVQDLLADWQTLCESRFGKPFRGPVIPFVQSRDQSWLHQFGKKVLLGIYIGYAFIAGRNWKGDIEELEIRVRNPRSKA